MKKFKILFVALLAIALPTFIGVGVASAQNFSTTVNTGDVIDSTLYSAGQDITIKGTINGDVFCAGQNIQIDATVHGDVICGGQTVVIKGQIDGDIRAAGQTVIVGADVAHNVTIAGQSVLFEDTAKVEGDATLTGNSLNLDGMIGRDVLLTGAMTTLNGSIGRNLETYGETLVINNAATIGGTLNYTSNNEAQIATGAQITGEVTRHTPEKPAAAEGPSEATLWGISIGFYLYMLAGMLLLGLLLALFLPQAVRRTGQIAFKKFGITLLTGFLAGLVVPAICIALAVTFVGIPLAFMIMIAWMLIGVIALPLAAHFYATLIFRKLKNTVGLMAIGVVLLVTVLFIPFIGWALAIISFWIGTGSLLIAIKQALPKPDYKG